MLEGYSDSVLSIEGDDSDLCTNSFVILPGYAHSIVLHLDSFQAIVFETDLYIPQQAISLDFGWLTTIKRQTNGSSLRI